MDTICPLKSFRKKRHTLAILFLIYALCMRGEIRSAHSLNGTPLQDDSPHRDNKSDPSDNVSVITKQSEELKRLITARDYAPAAKLAAAIWKTVDHSHITERDFQDLPQVLSQIADLCLNVYHDTPTGVRVLQYMAGLPGARVVRDNKATSFEWAASNLGRAYYDAGCQRNASYWLKQAVEFAQSRRQPSAPNREFIITNLWLLANASAILGDASGELRYNREILELVGENPSSHFDLKNLVQVGRAEVRTGDFDLGIRLLDTFRHKYSPTTDEEMSYTVQAYLAEGYGQLEKAHYAQIDQLTQEGLKLIDDATDPVFHDGKYEWRNAIYALTARSLIRQGHYQDAEREIFKVYKADELNNTFLPATAVGNIELLGDLARIYVHFDQFAQAFPAYISLARHYGELIGDPRRARTPRTRLFWLNQENAVVQELTSVWLSMPDSAVKKTWEPSVANALLQTKANLFLAADAHRAIAYHNFEGLDTELFARNRNYAKAAAKVLDDPSDGNAWSGLEDTFLIRESFEAAMVAGPMELMSSGSEEFSFDFRKLFQYDDKAALLDYSLVDFTYPRDGLRQPATKRVFVGIKVAKDNLTLVELGEESEVATKVKPFLEDVARPPRAGEGVKEVLLHGSSAFQAIVAPLGALPRSIYIAADGILSAVPFQALVDGDRFLIENHDMWIDHSLLARRALYLRQYAGMSADMYDNSAVVLIGDADYSGTRYASLEGTKTEIENVQHLFTTKSTSPIVAHGNVLVSMGSKANVDAILNSPHPLILHIAAHGEFWPRDIEQKASGLDDPFNPEPELTEGPLGALDEALLRSSIILSPRATSPPSPEDERRVTALELSSLNLLGTDLLILSACDTGLGIESQAAGVLGFQYAVQTTMVRYALLSLWEIDDRESGTVVSSIYHKWLLENQDISAAYTDTLRELCRDRGLPVHPFYWAAFILIKQDY
jgi:CHAT domain-containing protein